jgi:hypothetical protein
VMMDDPDLQTVKEIQIDPETDAARSSFTPWIGPELKTPIEQLDGGKDYLDLQARNLRGRSGILENAAVGAEDIPFAGLGFTAARAGKAVLTARKLESGNVANITDQELLTKLAKDSPEFYIRADALKRITNQAVVEDFCLINDFRVLSRVSWRMRVGSKCNTRKVICTQKPMAKADITVPAPTMPPKSQPEMTAANSMPPRPVPLTWCAKTNLYLAGLVSRVRLNHWY